MAPSLCENCHKRPKFGTHKFCSKTCAAQAAAQPSRAKQSQPQTKAAPRNVGRQKGGLAMCTYCAQKPKFNSFDYCSKSCATLAGAAQTKPPAPATQGIVATKQKAMHVPSAPPNNVQSLASRKSHKAPGSKLPVPQDDATEEGEEEEEEEEDGGISTDLDAYPSDSELGSEDEPSVPVVAISQPSAKSTPRGGKPGSGVPRIAPGICAIPGCGQPPHVSRNGTKTIYCSIRHREEAVKLGLETACIMCQRYPQSSSDYFCSSACRNQSMTKT